MILTTFATEQIIMKPKQQSNYSTVTLVHSTATILLETMSPHRIILRLL